MAVDPRIDDEELHRLISGALDKLVNARKEYDDARAYWRKHGSQPAGDRFSAASDAVRAAYDVWFLLDSEARRRYRSGIPVGDGRPVPPPEAK